jgi:hypothetical protein
MLVMLGGCAAPRTAEAPLFRPFSYKAVDGRIVSNETLAGRVSIIGVLASFDVPSQLEARALSSLARRHAALINTAVLMRESVENKPLVEVFARSVGLTCPIAMVDGDALPEGSAFSGLRGVPSILVLDRAGREAWRHVGFVSERTLEAVLTAVDTTR